MTAVARLVLAAMLALPGATLAGCRVSPELRRIHTPRDGVVLAYALEPGNGFEGTLRLGNTRQVEGLPTPLGQTATCDVVMAVVGKGPGGIDVRATFTSVELDWDLPPSATFSSQELLELAQEQLRGMQVSFTVRPDGRVQALPVPPADAPPELREVIETMLLGLEAFFVPLPAEPLVLGSESSSRYEHATADGLAQALEQTVRLDGTYEDREDHAVVVRRISIEQTRREQRPGDTDPVRVEREVEAHLLFSTTGFPAEVDRQTRELDPVRGVVFRKVKASWTRTRSIVPELVAPPSTDVQVIEDPCNPDYVGPKTCDDPAPGAPPSEGPPADGTTTPPGDAPVPNEDEGEGEAPAPDVTAPGAAWP